MQSHPRLTQGFSTYVNGTNRVKKGATTPRRTPKRHGGGGHRARRLPPPAGEAEAAAASASTHSSSALLAPSNSDEAGGNRRGWKTTPFKIVTEGGEALPVVAPPVVSGQYDDDFESLSESCDDDDDDDDEDDDDDVDDDVSEDRDGARGNEDADSDCDGGGGSGGGGEHGHEGGDGEGIGGGGGGSRRSDGLRGNLRNREAAVVSARMSFDAHDGDHSSADEVDEEILPGEVATTVATSAAHLPRAIATPPTGRRVGSAARVVGLVGPSPSRASPWQPRPPSASAVAPWAGSFAGGGGGGVGVRPSLSRVGRVVSTVSVPISLWATISSLFSLSSLSPLVSPSLLSAL
jgi:hypothetical protein